MFIATVQYCKQSYTNVIRWLWLMIVIRPL